jgi:hypothetical protein
MRGSDEESTAQITMDGMRIYYNFIRPHMALNGRTPAQKARVMRTEESNWKTLIRKSSNIKRQVSS